MTFSRSQLSGKWHNQHGSEIRIEVAEDGRLTGTFESATGFAKDKPCPLVGFATETLIAFTVDFSKYDSLTSWTGHCVVEEGEPVVHASWHMSVASRQHSGKWLRSFGSSTRSTVQEKLCIQSFSFVFSEHLGSDGDRARREALRGSQSDLTCPALAESRRQREAAASR